MRVAVVGHVEWVEFLRVARVPAQGEIVHTRGSWAEPAGGGGVAAVVLVRLVGSADFFTALGDDELGHRAYEELGALGVTIHAVWRPEPQRRALTYVDDEGERTITVVGDRLAPHGHDALPWGELAGADAVYFTGGDAEALRLARAARVLTASPRTLETLSGAGVQLDALIGSGRDPGERYEPGDIEPPPRLVVRTLGREGGVAEPGGPFPGAPLPGPLVDTYGAGDSFAAALTYALAQPWTPEERLALAARCGAVALTRRGAHGAQ